MALSMDDKYNHIYAHEEQFAYMLGKEVIQKPEASAWMILIPILFLHHMYRVNQYKAGVRAFADGFFSPRKKALDKAYKETSTGKKIHYELQDYFPDHTIDADNQEKTLAEKQVRVIRVMEKHYLALLKASARSYEGLIKEVYPTRAEYQQYLRKLESTEKDLYELLKTEIHTTEESRQVIKKMKKGSERLRAEEVRRLF